MNFIGRKFVWTNIRIYGVESKKKMPIINHFVEEINDFGFVTASTIMRYVDLLYKIIFY